jgi:iron-sulfur cluster repair protein YtfE (RIC family)
MEMMLWNMVLTTLIGILAYMGHEKASEIQRLNILLNKTREEVARDNVTQAEVSKIVEHIDSRFNRLESKIDGLIQKG